VAQSAATCLCWFLACGFFYPEAGGHMFLRNVHSHKIYTAQHPRRRHSSEHEIFTKIYIFEVLTAVVIKSPIFWDITPFTPLKVNRSFGVICCIYYQGRRINQVRDRHEAGSKQHCLAHSSILKIHLLCTYISVLNATYYLVTLLPHYMFRLHMVIIRCCLSC
jgi:hypothetical protein